MAEQVQAVLDGMVAPLQDWQQRGIFSPTEVHAIVNRRRSCEYAIRRRQPRKADFLRYIQQEVQLEQLRQLRTKRWQQEQRQKDYELLRRKQRQLVAGEDDEVQQQEEQKTTTSATTTRLYGFIGDKHVVQHIHYLWTRTLRKYRADVSLYLEYANFCKSHASLHRLAAVYAQALQLHPNEIGLWIQAASHEFFYNHQIYNARILLQRAVRLHPTTAHDELWVQMFTLELHFIQKLEGRKQVLLGNTDSSSGKDDDGGGEGGADGIVTESNTPKDEHDDDAEAQDVFKICRLVYKNAISAMKKADSTSSSASSINKHKKKHDTVAFRLRFWDACRLFPKTQVLQKEIVDSIRSDLCRDDAQAWTAWALYAWDQEQQQANKKDSDSNLDKDEGSDKDDDDDDDDDEQPRRKKQRQDEDDDDEDGKDGKDSSSSDEHDDDDHDEQSNTPTNDVMSILQLAIESLPTEEMYLKAIRMMIRYVEYLDGQQAQQKEDNGDSVASGSEEDSEEFTTAATDKEVRAIKWIATTFQKAAVNDEHKVYSCAMVLEHADFMTRVASISQAIQVLQDFVEARAGDADSIKPKVWVKLAKLVHDEKKEQQELSRRGQDEDLSGNGSNSDSDYSEDEGVEQWNRDGLLAAIPLLEKALSKIPMTRKEHLGIMLHLFGAKLQLVAGSIVDEVSADDGDLFSLFQRILLLAPGFVSGWQSSNNVSSNIADKNDDDDDNMMVIDASNQPAFDVGSVADACLRYLHHVYQYHDGMQMVRNVYRAVLYESTILATILSAPNQQGRAEGAVDDGGDDDEHGKVAAFVEDAIQMERECSRSSDGRRSSKKDKSNTKQLSRLYDAASKLFGKSPLGDAFRQERNEDLLYGRSQSTNVASRRSTATCAVPHFDAALKNFSANEFISAFGKYQVVRLSNVAAFQNQQQQQKQNLHESLTWKNIAHLFERLDESDKASWCIETPFSAKGGEAPQCAAHDFLQPRVTNDRGYCSFLVQKDEAVYRETLKRLPVCDLPSGSSDGEDALEWKYDNPGALWIFFGRNNSNTKKATGESTSLKGRPEHTDSISTDGTWHYQLAGKKTWCLRPTGALLKHMKRHLSSREAKSWTTSTRVNVECKKGEVIVINTRLWFHATHIPSQATPSVSYARDFCLRRPSESSSNGGTQEEKSSLGMTMTNVDGLYASADIEEATIIFRESDMPDCELHRSSTNPNCEVVELEDGSNAVISKRPIAAGEFFCVADSSEEEEEEEEEEYDENDEAEEDDD